MYKQIYAQHGPEGMDQASFRTLWREHGQIAASAPDFIRHVHRNVQGDCLNDLALDIGQSEAFQGVAEVFYEDPAGRDAALSSTGAREKLVPHAMQTKIFSASPPIRLFGEEKEWIPLRAEQGIKLFTFTRRKASVSEDRFAAKVRRSAEELLAMPELKPLLLGFSQSIASDPGDYQAVDELTFKTVEDLEKAWSLLSQDGRPRADQARYADPDSRVVIIVSINVIHDDRKAAA
jgi:hypothetical protein